MRYILGVVTAATLVLALPARSDAQTIEAGPVKLDFTGRIQVQYNTSTVDEEELGLADGEFAASTFETRRVRLTAELTIEDWITGKIEPDFALGRLALKETWMNLAFDPRLQLKVGQFKKPFSRIELTSSSVIAPIERGVRIRGLEDRFRAELDPEGFPFFTDFDGDVLFGDEYQLLDLLGYLGYDIGAQLHGRLGRVGYAVGIFNGEGPDERDDNDAKSAAARVTWAPLADAPLSVGAGASYRELFFDGAIDGVGVTGRLAGTAFEVDAEWGAFRRPGLHFIGELAFGESLAIDEPLLAAQGIASYFRPLGGERVEGVEPLLRVSFADPNTDRDGDHGLLLTPGVNLYFFGRNRLMLNWDAFVTGGDRDRSESALRAQAQLYF